MLTPYHNERKLLQIQNGKLHGKIWQLGKQNKGDDQIICLKKELHDNEVRIRTLNYLIRMDIIDPR